MRHFRWLWLLLLVPVATGLIRLRFDAEVLNLLPTELPVVRGLQLYQQHFASGDELVITLKSPDVDATENAVRSIAERLRSETNLVSRVTWQAPWLENPGASAELLAYLWLNQPPAVFGELTNRLIGPGLTETLLSTRDQLATSFSPEEIARAAYDPLGLMNLPESASSGVPAMENRQFFSSEDGTFRLIFVEPAVDTRNYREAMRWIGSVTNIISKQAAEFGVQVGMTGSPAFISEISQDMERDMRNSVAGTGIIIAALFWWTHRRFRPLLWLLTLLAVILVTTMALGGLIYGSLNVVSLGFAAILLGLAVDYGLVLFQEAKAEPDKPIRELTRTIAPSILWAAITSAGAFVFLNLSGLPGLGQLGTLVAIGTIVAAAVMLSAYLPPLVKSFHHRTREQRLSQVVGKSGQRSSFWIWLLSAILLVGSIVLLRSGRLVFDHSPEALRPNNSQAYRTMEQIKLEIGGREEPLWVIASGKTETEVLNLLRKTKTLLDLAVSNNLVSSFKLATPLWPDPVNQQANHGAIRQLLANEETIHEVALSLDFAPESLALTKNFFATWRRALDSPIFWPTNRVSLWALDKVIAKHNGQFLALGLVYPGTNAISTTEPDYSRTEQLVESWPPELEREGVLLSGWTALGTEMFELVERDLLKVLLPMLVLISISLGFAFRRVAEVLLSIAALLFSGLCLAAIMVLAGWSWNLMNMMAAPLLLGVGVDYTIHMQLALKRHRGNIQEVRRTVGRALMLCGSTTIAGFGSLAFSSNAGMASLGRVCAAGIAICMLTSLFLLPGWWKSLSRNVEGAESSAL